MKKETLTLAMAKLQKIYGKLDTDKIEVYSEVLCDIPEQSFINGIKKLLQEYEYPTFPQPATIIRYCKESEVGWKVKI